MLVAASRNRFVGGCIYSRGVAHSSVVYTETPTGGIGDTGNSAQPTQPVKNKRARKRPKDAPTHVRSWPLRPTPAQQRHITIRYNTGRRVYNAVLGEMLGRARRVRADPDWDKAAAMPNKEPSQRAARNKAFDVVKARHGYSKYAANTYASSLRQTWVRQHFPSQETQNIGTRAFTAVNDWMVGKKVDCSPA